MKTLLVVLGCLLAAPLTATVWPVGPGRAHARIADAIQAAAAGDTLSVEPGFYEEGNILIEKPLALIGQQYPVVNGSHAYEIFTVKSPDVTISGFQIENSGQMNTIDIAGIKVLAVDRVRIEYNKVYRCNFGIYLSNAKDCTVRYNDVHGVPAEEQNTGNGIHLWKCERARIEGNYTAEHRDGIYFEFVTDSDIAYNFSEKNIRYGLHFMFSHNDRYAFNHFYSNGAGVAVMYSRQVTMHDNLFDYNWGSAAYGILLKDITDSKIHHNRFEFNSAAIYMEGASRMTVTENEFRENGWAVRIQASCDANVLRQNNFLGNTFDVSTNGHLVLNTFENNYWDKYEGYDLDHDGTGDIPFRPVSLYAVVVEQMPHGLLLMRSFMVYLMDKAEKVMPSLTPEKLMDERPLMHPFVSASFHSK